jgi:chromosome segregation ATPase
VFGCFSDFQIIKQLSMGAVIGGGIGLGTSALMAELYAKTAANALERDLLRKQSAVDAASRKANDLETEVESWKLRHSQAELKVETLENSLDTLTREVIHSRQSKATMEVTLGEFQARLSIASDELNQAQARISLISSEFASNAKITLNQAVSDWKSNLTNALDASLKKRPDLQPQLSKLRGEVTALCDGHLKAIAQLTHRGNLNQFADEAFTLLWQAASEISSLKCDIETLSALVR